MLLHVAFPIFKELHMFFGIWVPFRKPCEEISAKPPHLISTKSLRVFTWLFHPSLLFCSAVGENCLFFSMTIHNY